MAAARSKTTRIAAPSRRTQVVWVTFIGAMTLVTGLLAIGREQRPGGFVATNLSSIPLGSTRDTAATDPVFKIAAPVDRQRWRGIVIHHLGAPAGDAESIHRRHLGLGYQGLGYHFLIGNGNGLEDGVVHVGYRWNQQLPGVHTTGPQADIHNLHSIGICLIGNGDRRPFTDRQMRHLVALVQRLQRELNIPASAVHLHRDLSPRVTSPGRSFPTAQFEDQLLAVGR